MKKILMIILSLSVFGLVLSVYSVNTLKSSMTQHQKETRTLRNTNRMINSNRKQWDKQIANADVIESNELKNDGEPIASSLEQLQNHSKLVIEGTVYNLQKMNSPKNMAYTKVELHIDKVISGDKDIQGKRIYLAMAGGLVSFDHWYANMSKPKDFNHEILVNIEEAPLPKIGSKVITGVIPNVIDESSEYNDALKQSGFTINNSYAISNQQYNVWIKNPGKKKYVLNNTKVNKRAAKNNDLTKALQKLTDQINKKYNEKGR